MKKTARSLDQYMSEEERNKSIKELIAFYLDERGEELDIIGASNLLDSFLQNIAPIIYNKAIEDTKTVVRNQIEQIDIEVSALKKN